VGLWGDFVLKPPHIDYPGMPELEHACMLMARTCGIDTVPFALMPLESGEMAYLCRRIDRDGNGKLHMEDMAQLTGKMTEQKYRGTMEQVGKAVWLYSSTPLLDAVRLFELTLFCFLTANSDMHLKNFSLAYGRDGRIRLSPAYDLLATQVLLPDDKEELAMPLNGRKAGLTVRDFEAFAERLRLSPKQCRNVLTRMTGACDGMAEVLAKSFALDEHKRALVGIVRNRAARMGTPN
jgi:serine/threonine-protein kinase HipA